MKILIAVDGSPSSTKAVRFVVNLARELATPPEVTLFHANPPLLNSVVKKLGPDATKRYYADNFAFATRSARSALKRARVAFDEEQKIAEPAEAIMRYAKKERVDLIVMGSHGRSVLRGLLLGSVTSKVIAHCEIPVAIAR